MRPFVKCVWLLLWALKKCPAYEGRTVYRGVPGVDLSGTYEVGDEFSWHQFSSCTSDLSVQNGLLGASGSFTMFHVDLTSGRGRLIRDHSVLRLEEEVLLPPNSRFRVVGHSRISAVSVMVQLVEIDALDPILDFGDR